MAEFGVGMKPTVANQFKRGSFLEVLPKQSHCRMGSQNVKSIHRSTQKAAP